NASQRSITRLYASRVVGENPDRLRMSWRMLLGSLMRSNDSRRGCHYRKPGRRNAVRSAHRICSVDDGTHEHLSQTLRFDGRIAAELSVREARRLTLCVCSTSLRECGGPDGAFAYGHLDVLSIKARRPSITCYTAVTIAGPNVYRVARRWSLLSCA